MRCAALHVEWKLAWTEIFKFSKAVWKKIGPEMYYVLLEGCLWKDNLKDGIVQSLVVTMEKGKQNAFK